MSIQGRGRPKIDVRMDLWEKNALEAYARENGITTSDIIRELMQRFFRENNITRETYAAAIEGQISTDELGV